MTLCVYVQYVKECSAVFRTIIPLFFFFFFFQQRVSPFVVAIAAQKNTKSRRGDDFGCAEILGSLPSSPFVPILRSGAQNNTH